jgi:hypothetical protein
MDASSLIFYGQRKSWRYLQENEYPPKKKGECLGTLLEKNTCAYPTHGAKAELVYIYRSEKKLDPKYPLIDVRTHDAGGGGRLSCGGATGAGGGAMMNLCVRSDKGYRTKRHTFTDDWLVLERYHSQPESCDRSDRPDAGERVLERMAPGEGDTRSLKGDA